jgi:hypothetical protein
VERYIRTIKERVRSIYNSLPFKRMPSGLIVEMTYASVFWLNCFPHPHGISPTLSPRTIVTGQSIDYSNHCKYEFGDYVQTHEEHNNDMAERTIGAIATRPSGNTQGGFFFYSLNSGKCIHRYNATPLPMPNEILNRIHVLA